MQTTLWIVGAYVAIGGAVMFVTWEPEQDGWLWSVLLWPLALYSKLVN